jgi:hypothetical protein
MTSLHACFFDILAVNVSSKDTLLYVCLANKCYLNTALFRAF